MVLAGFRVRRMPFGFRFWKRENETLKSPSSVGENACVISCVRGIAIALEIIAVGHDSSAVRCCCGLRGPSAIRRSCTTSSYRCVL